MPNRTLVKFFSEQMDHLLPGAIGLFEVPRTIIAETSSGNFRVTILEWEDREERNETLGLLKEDFKKHGVVQYICIMETWTVDETCGYFQMVRKITKNMPEELRKEFMNLAIQKMPPPRLHPDRKDTLLLLCTDGKERLIRSFEIQRKDQTITHLLPMASSRGCNRMESPLFELLPTQGEP